MNKCLILLTSCFPYDNKETFLENEIDFHSKHFNKIIILAQELSPEVNTARRIPDNAEAHNIARKKKRIARYGDVFNGALRFFNPTEACKTDRKRIGKSIPKKVFCEYFEQRSQRQFKESIEVLKNFDFSVFDEVVIYSYWFFVICRTGMLLKEYFESKNINVKFFSRAHRYDLYENVNKLNYLPLREYMVKDVDYVFACSENGSNYLKKMLPEYSDKIGCSYLGTLDNGITSYDKLFHIVTCSRTTSVKCLDKLVDALSYIEKSGKEIYWTHIGDGPLQNIIKEQCREKLKSINYEFLGDMDNAQVLDYYLSHPISLFINVSRSEGLPVSIMEALSFGIPVLATDVGGTNEIIKDGFNGYLLNEYFSNKDFEVVFNKIYLSDESKYNDLRLNARKYWEEHFNAEKNYPVFCNMISAFEKPLNI